MISVITPVWNKSSLTHRFIFQHHQHYRATEDFELIIIDNGSTDNTDAVLRQWCERWPAVKVISNAENAGFGPANNQGAAFAQGDILVFMSNDVSLAGDYITPIKAALQDRPKSLVGAALYLTDTGWNTFTRIADDIPTIETVSYLGGWCVGLTKEAFADLGGWDERYIPSDFEDVDLSYTATLKGYDLVGLPLPLSHLSGATASQLPDRWAMTVKHRRWFAEKWGFEP